MENSKLKSLEVGAMDECYVRFAELRERGGAGQGRNIGVKGKRIYKKKEKKKNKKKRIILKYNFFKLYAASTERTQGCALCGCKVSIFFSFMISFFFL